jgi:hypothetical protein
MCITRRKTEMMLENRQAINFPWEHRTILGQLFELCWIWGGMLILYRSVNASSTYQSSTMLPNAKRPPVPPSCQDRVRVVVAHFFDHSSGPQQYFSTKLPTEIQFLGSRPAKIHVFFNFALCEVCTVSLSCHCCS